VVCRVDADELDPEPPERVQGDVEGEEPWWPWVKAPFDDIHEKRCGKEVPKELVQERRVIGRVVDRCKGPVAWVDLEAPGKVGWLPEELLVPPVADPSDRLRDEQTWCKTVGEQPYVGTGPLCDEAADKTPCCDPAPDTEATLPDREWPPPLIGNLVPARREVVEPGTDDARADAPDGTTEDQVPVAAAVDPARAGDPHRHPYRCEQRQPVHMDRQWPKLNGAVSGRGDRGEQRHASSFSPQGRTPPARNATNE
jgi:hypothetical protein